MHFTSIWFPKRLTILPIFIEGFLIYKAAKKKKEEAAKAAAKAKNDGGGLKYKF